MRQFKSIALIALTALALTACSTSKDEVEQNAEQELYSKAQSYLKDENYTQASRYLEAVKNRFPGSQHAEESLLNLVYANFKLEDYSAALIAADRFLQEFPNSKNTDYMLYIAALTHYASSENSFQNFFGIDKATRENSSLKLSFVTFKSLIEHFPNSKYVEEAKAYLAYIKETLARHELVVANFYDKRNAHVAVSNRVLGMLQLYPDTEATYQALPLLEKAHQALNLKELAEKTHQLIEENKGTTFPEIPKPEKRDPIPPVY